MKNQNNTTECYGFSSKVFYSGISCEKSVVDS